MFLSKGVGVEARGSAGGIISLWNEDHFMVISCISIDRCIILFGELIALKRVVVLCNVYAPNNEREMVELWRFILKAQFSLPVPWIIGVDFNTVLDKSEEGRS
ncbi:hypothetical protein Ddye_032192 [Dipteronia dyeriana]|uniref:Endonuclease/exonuclease/phosphatase domain-containing protein n=1 Tax=Dipteronia dyeriana TaxID=168575 RepID=A0AAD9TJQ4_9ROSI|nr:hypothetical protein Ddye_032192 [Dipteronia dyeriana]